MGQFFSCHSHGKIYTMGEQATAALMISTWPGTAVHSGSGSGSGSIKPERLANKQFLVKLDNIRAIIASSHIMLIVPWLEQVENQRMHVSGAGGE